MRIGFIDWMCNPARPGASGLSDIVWSMAHHLVSAGDEVHVFGPYSVDFNSHGVHVHRFKLPPLGYRNILGHSLIAVKAILEANRAGPWDIIHAPEYLTTALCTILMPGTPVVLTVPGNIFERIANINHFDRYTTQVYKMAARLTARKSKAIIATSQIQAQWWAYSGAIPKRIVTIPLGVDTNTFKPGKIKTTENVLFIGRLQRENGADLAIKAFAHVKAVLPHSTLTIVGDGSDRENLITLTEKLNLSGSICWIDRINYEELPAIYQSAQVFLFPRLSRVTPRVLFEAMACGLPVVTSSIGGINDFVVNGETGFLENPHDYVAVAQRVVELLKNPELSEQMSQNARRIAENKLDWNVIVSQVRSEVYKPLLESRK
ncbi:MAG TPA: glycosyltransferase family 4 protein [Chloroflexia bacterium]|nr:glycosyltransferase family 4 protein [Chloroflexia bacterium]